jgi:hypothetical protein
LTQLWRAQRHYATVMYPACLAGDLPDAFTCDNFHNVATLELELHFGDCLALRPRPRVTLVSELARSHGRAQL